MKAAYDYLLFHPTRPLCRRLVDVAGMTADDWKRVWLAYRAFIHQVRLIVAEVQTREGKV